MTIAHVMIRVLDFGASQKFYGALGMTEIDRYAFGPFNVCYLADKAGMQIELIENVGRKEPYTHGDGYGNVAFVVADIRQARDALIAAGAQPGPVKDIAHSGTLFGRYFHVTDPDGYRLEVLESAGRWQAGAPGNRGTRK